MSTARARRRLTGAVAAGIPQVVVPGCLDFTNWWVGEVPERYRQREFFQYNLEILLMRTNADEFAALGRLMGERLSAARGPVSVLIPSGGWSALVGRNAHDLSGAITGPWARPDADKVWVDTLRRHFAGTIQELPHHINDAAFADACVDELDRLLVAEDLGAACRAAHDVDHGDGCVRCPLAAPRDVAIRTHQHQRHAIERCGLIVVDAMHGERHAASGRCGFDRSSRQVGEFQQHEAVSEQVENRRVSP